MRLGVRSGTGILHNDERETETGTREKPLLVAEFKKALSLYRGTILA
jgi:hypothetical protein